MLCVIGCCLFVYCSDIYRLCPGWGSVRKFDADGNEDQRAREDLLQREYAQHQAALMEGTPAAAKVYGSIGKPTWGVLEAPTQREVLVQHPVHGEVKVRENFEDTQRLRRESSWWAKDERFFMEQSKVSRTQLLINEPTARLMGSVI
ncbi:unnamed protein product [Symbiodinium natans]|uniref:Uncharacterized protein n=1 Tax=Symbiodinium natans TaxID=878477 RepID=A0A812TP71_9DINO|nr:unnamed protein product [Symbiodinium natans]